MMTEVIYSTILPWFVVALFILIVIVTFCRVPFVISSYLKLSGFGKWVILFAVVAGTFMRFAWIPDGHRILFDEDRYLSYAVSFARFGKAVSLEFATPNESIIGKPDQAIRVTIPVVHALVFRIFEMSEKAIFINARIFSVMQIILIAIIALYLFKSPFIAGWASTGMAFLPSAVYWSVSAGLDNYFVTFSLLSIVAVCWYAQKPGFFSAVYATGAIFLLLCVRSEGFFMLPVLFGIYYCQRQSLKEPILRKKDAIAILILIMMVTIRIFLSLSVFTKRWCCAEGLPLEAFSLQYTIRNFLPNIWTFLGKIEFPAFISILAVVALIRMKDRVLAVLGLWIFIFFAVYSSYYAGIFYTYEFSGSYGRYFLLLQPPLLLLSGFFLNDLFKNYSSIYEKYKSAVVLTLFFVAASLIPTAVFYRRMIAVSPYDRLVEYGPRLLHIFMTDRLLPKVEKDAVLIFPLTAYPLLSDHTVIYNDTFNKEKEVQKKVAEMLKSGKTAYILQTNYCQIKPQRCEDILSVFEFRTYLSEAIDNTIFQMDRMFLKEASGSSDHST